MLSLHSYMSSNENLDYRFNVYILPSSLVIHALYLIITSFFDRKIDTDLHK